LNHTLEKGEKGCKIAKLTQTENLKREDLQVDAHTPCNCRIAKGKTGRPLF